MGIKAKLLAIQCELKAPKGQFNSFGKYHYRSCEDILEAVKPICGKNNAVLTLSDEVVNVGNRFYIKATATLSDTESEKVVTVTAYAREEEDKKGMDGSQITGAASSYARKYALNGLFNIDDTEDSDSTNKGDDKKDDKKAEVKTAEKKTESKNVDNTVKPSDTPLFMIKPEDRSLHLMDLIKGSSVTGVAVRSWIKATGKEAAVELTNEEFEGIVNSIKKQIGKKA